MATPPARVKLYSPLGSRAASIFQDSRIINGFAEKGEDEGEVWVYKRPGMQNYMAMPSGTAQGVFYWNTHIYAIIGGILYQDGTSVGTVDATAPYKFSSCLGAVHKLFFQNTVNGYTYDSTNGLVQVTNINYPTGLVPGAVYVDGTMYVAGSNASIYGSELNDPQTWDPLNFLIAQIEPEPAVALTKQLVYVICLKTASTEVFYDAGNGTGSPLGPVQGSKVGVGCRAAGSVKKAGDDVCWVGTTTEGDVQVMTMSKVHAEAISTPPVDRLLKPLNFTPCWSWTARVSGHRFYVVTLPSSNLTLAFDLTSAAWYIWTDTNGNYLPIFDSTYDGSGNPVLQHATNGKLYTFEAATFQDDGAAIPFSLYTMNIDAGTKVEKACGKLEVVADQDHTSINISWSDDDYQTYTTPQAVALNVDRPWLQDGSSFSRRSYLITHSDQTALRIKALDLTIAPGTL